MMECTPEYGHCHSVYSVGYPPYLIVLSILEYVLYRKHPLKTDFIRQASNRESPLYSQLVQAVRYGLSGLAVQRVHRSANHPLAVHYQPLTWAGRRVGPTH
jgi:hypothetical protein